MCSECDGRNADPDETSKAAALADQLQIELLSTARDFIVENLPESYVGSGYESGMSVNITLLALDLARKSVVTNGGEMFGDEQMMTIQERIKMVSEQMVPVRKQEGEE